MKELQLCSMNLKKFLKLFIRIREKLFYSKVLTAVKIIRLKSKGNFTTVYIEMYLEYRQISTMELFAKIVCRFSR